MSAEYAPPDNCNTQDPMPVLHNSPFLFGKHCGSSPTCFPDQEVVDWQHAASIACVEDAVRAQLPGAGHTLRGGVQGCTHLRVIQPDLSLTAATEAAIWRCKERICCLNLA